MATIRELLKVRPHEERLVLLVTGAMFATTMGAAIGTPGADALFFTRFGVEYLPVMYVVLGMVTMVLTLIMTGVLGRIPNRIFYLTTPVVLAFLLTAAWIVLMFDYRWFYPVLWLGVSITWTLQALFTWGTAGAVCDTRQAKRLFPLFGAGGILGIALGGLLTGPLSRFVPAEDLILFWAAGMLLAGIFTWLLLRSIPPENGERPGNWQTSSSVSILTEMQQGYQVVRNSRLLKWLSAGSIIFAILYFTVVFPFSSAASAQFPNENDLSGFLGVFMGLATGIAFLVSIFIANRLYARFGVTNMILGYAVIYAVSFLILSLTGSFSVLVGARFILIIWYQGVASAAFQALINIVPPERRDQTRAFIQGVPEQFGVMLAGAILILSERILTPNQLFMLGGLFAVLVAYVAWRASREYRNALMDALRAGQHQFFYSEEEQFGGFPRDAAAIAAVVAGITNPDPVVRRVSAEILGQIPIPEARDAMVAALDDEDPQVRASLLRSLALSKATPALLDIVTCLQDPEPVVRREALMAMQNLAGYQRGLGAQVSPVLEDPDISVQATAAGVLLELGQSNVALAKLEELVTCKDDLERAEAYRALQNLHEVNPAVRRLLMRGLNDPATVVKRAAVIGLAECADETALTPLIHLLADEDPSIRAAAARGLGQIGVPALNPTLGALSASDKLEGALMALEYLPVENNQEMILDYARSEVVGAVRYHQLGSQMPEPKGDAGLELLVESVERASRRRGRYALQAIKLVSNGAAIGIALINLESISANQRANAIEILETIDEAELVRPLLPLWDSSQSDPDPADGWLPLLLDDPDEWLRACTVLVAGRSTDPKIHAMLERLATNDADEIVRDAAASVLNRDKRMETLQTLSIMERIIFLRRVPLFQDLSPVDLQRVASIAREELYPDGSTIAQQGETGDEMFIIVSGEVGVSVLADGGKYVEVARRGVGEYVGEMAIISHEPRMASLVAIGEVRMIRIGQKEFEDILRERPETSLSVMRVLCDRLREQAISHEMST